MRLLRLALFLSLVLSVELVCGCSAHADSTVTIFPAGSGGFSIRGNLLEKVATVDITVDYDAGTLSNPNASCGALAADAKCDIDTTTSGLVRILISSATPLSGLENLAYLSFTSQGDELGTINSLDAILTDSNGAMIPVVANVVNPTTGNLGLRPPALLQNSPPDPPRTESPTTGDAIQGISESNSNLRPTEENKDLGVAGADEATSKNEATPKPVTNAPVYHSCPDILQRFRDYHGDLSLGSFLSLITHDNVCGAMQTPSIAISDGINRVVVTLEIEPGKNAPNLGCTGARILNLWRHSDRAWSVELLPNKGEHCVVLYAQTEKDLKSIPLIVAPPLALYFKDLSPEQKLSPLLEFVVAANYLAFRNEKTVLVRH